MQGGRVGDMVLNRGFVTRDKWKISSNFLNCMGVHTRFFT